MLPPNLADSKSKRPLNLEAGIIRSQFVINSSSHILEGICHIKLRLVDFSLPAPQLSVEVFHLKEECIHKQEYR